MIPEYRHGRKGGRKIQTPWRAAEPPGDAGMYVVVQASQAGKLST